MSFSFMDAAPSKDPQAALLFGGDAAASDFELAFLDEFLEHDGLVPSPQSPAPSDGAATDGSAASPALHPLLEVDAFASEKRAGVDFEAVAAAAEAQLALVMQNVGNRASPGSPSHSSTSGDEDEDGANGGEPLDRKARRRAQVAISARRHRSRKKHEMIDLRKEVTYLHAQLDFLRSKHKLTRPSGAVAEWEERAMAQRRKRRQTELQNEELRRAVFLQSTYIGNFRALFTTATLASTTEINMRQLLHTYTRLGPNAHSRQRDYDAICTDAKLDLAMDVVARETAALDVLTPSILVHHLRPGQQEFGATTVSAYAFDTLDIREIFVAACAAIRDTGREWPGYAPVDADVQVVAAPRDNVRYGTSRIRYRSDLESAEEVTVESRAISYYRVAETYGVLLWDFVDDDDLYPLGADTTMKRDVVGSALVRREVCADGVERVVCRILCTKIHSHKRALPTPDIVRFSQSTDTGSDVCGSVVYNTIRDEFVSHRLVVS